jgi:hypothetical protein
MHPTYQGDLLYHINARSVSLILVTSLMILYLSSGRALGAGERDVVITVIDGGNGKPLEGVEVKIIHPGGEEIVSVTGSDGTLSLILLPGDYQIRTALSVFGTSLWWGSYFLDVESGSSTTVEADIFVSNPFIPVKYLPLVVYGIIALLVFLAFYWGVIGRLGKEGTGATAS